MTDVDFAVAAPAAAARGDDAARRLGPWGFPLRADVAQRVAAMLKDRPAGHAGAYRRRFAPAASEPLAAAADDDRTEVSVVTSAAVDRDGEAVDPEGVDVSAFRMNPVVTFAHRYDQLPVGRALWIERDGDRVKAKTRYAPRPRAWTGDWLPDAIWHMVRAGDLRGKSIGFVPLAGGPPTRAEVARRPAWRDAHWIHRRVLLLEYAVAPVQSNPEALVEAVAKGMVSPATAAALGLAPLPGEGREPGPAARLARRLCEADARGAWAARVAAAAEARWARRWGRV